MNWPGLVFGAKGLNVEESVRLQIRDECCRQNVFSPFQWKMSVCRLHSLTEKSNSENFKNQTTYFCMKSPCEAYPSVSSAWRSQNFFFLENIFWVKLLQTLPWQKIFFWSTEILPQRNFLQKQNKKYAKMVIHVFFVG